MPRILIIDDEEDFRKLLRAILEQAGFEVLEAPDAPSGFALFQENLVDLLVVDLVMPKVSGVDFIHRLRFRFPDAKIIALSGGGPMGDFDLLAAARVLGAHRAFLKPFKQTELIAAIKELVPV